MDKKACDVNPDSWIVGYLHMYVVAVNIKIFLVNSIENWRVMVCAENFSLVQSS